MEEKVIEDNIENSINDDEWGDLPDNDLGGMGDPDDYENIQGDGIYQRKKKL